MRPGSARGPARRIPRRPWSSDSGRWAAGGSRPGPMRIAPARSRTGWATPTRRSPPPASRRSPSAGIRATHAPARAWESPIACSAFAPHLTREGRPRYDGCRRGRGRAARGNGEAWRRDGVRPDLRHLPPPDLPLHRCPHAEPSGRGGSDTAGVPEGPRGAPALRGTRHPLRGLALQARQERGDRPRADAPGARRFGRGAGAARHGAGTRIRHPRPRRDRGDRAGARRPDRRTARSHRAPLLRRAFCPGGGSGDGQTGRNGPGAPVPGDRGASPPAGPGCSRRHGPRAMTMDRQDEWDDDGELGARLEAYAESHLEPDPAATARARAAVMAEANRVLGAGRTAREAAGPGLLRRLFQRPALAATAAVLGLAVLAGGAVAASGPGGPLYSARLWVETLTLPSDTTARAAAELDRLQARLDEATAAAASGNGDAVTAALDAYRQTLADAAALAAGDPTREQHLIAELGKHLAVLEALAAGVPANAAAAIQAAVLRTEGNIDAITQLPGQPGENPTPGNPNGTPPLGGPDATQKPGNPSPGNPNATPTLGNPNPGQPGPTTKPGNPNGTPDPGRPNGTPAPGNPDHSPKPGHSPNPGGPNGTPQPPGG